MIALDLDDISSLDHVVVLAPYRSDADYLRSLLTEHHIQVEITSSNDLADRLAASPGVLVATNEALTPSVLDIVAKHLQAQPPWSEMPIVVLLDRASPNARVQAELLRAWPRARQLFYQRPVAPIELLSGIQSALLVRLRQREVRDHIGRETELRRELNHRVKNILASVSSIFEMTLRGATSMDAFAEDFRGRLRALDKVHSAVFHAQGETASLREIANLTFEPYHLASGDRIVTAGPEVILSRDAATTLALCLHELATNSIKYGALSNAEGHVRFEWDLSQGEQPELSICWRESDGPRVVEPAQAGYGTRYVRSALTGLFGQRPIIVFDPGGLRCEAHGALSRVQRR